MSVVSQAFSDAAGLIVSANADLVEIIALSIGVTATAVIIACLIGFPLGALLAVTRFPGRNLVLVVINTTMGLPPVVVGLSLYLALSAAGPLGALQLLYTPTAMVIAQVILAVPIVASLTHQVTKELHREYQETLRSMGASKWQSVQTVFWDARYSLLTAALAGFGRANAEVGAVMIVGGNINHLTRMMTTAIAMETSRGDLALALALGIVLMVIALFINGALWSLTARRERFAHV